MTPPPPASPGLRTGYREMRRRAPVSDRPGASPGAAGSSLPCQGRPLVSLCVPQAVFYVGIDWAAGTHAVCVMDVAGKVVARFTVAHSAEGLDRLVRQLAGLLDAHWPGGKAIFAGLDSRIALEFLARSPTAASAARLDEAGIAAFCREMGYSGKRPAAVLLQRLRAAPARNCGHALTTAVRDAV